MTASVSSVYIHVYNMIDICHVFSLVSIYLFFVYVYLLATLIELCEHQSWYFPCVYIM